MGQEGGLRAPIGAHLSARSGAERSAEFAELIAQLAPYRTAQPMTRGFQLVSSIGFYVLAYAAMLASMPVSPILTLALAVPTGALLVRVFIVQHDCGHGALFGSQRANNWVGNLCSLLTFTPYANWRRQHAGHHGNWNNLDRRDGGVDIYSTCLTVREYARLPLRRRFVYRLTRHPVVAHLLIPPLVFIALYRLPFDTPASWTRERRSVYWTNAGLAALLTSLGLALGFDRVLLVQLSILVVASIIGVWLFAVQHRFDHTVWLRAADWSLPAAALKGSSLLHLPRVLQWFTGNIGFHHVHHLDPRIPNYRLEECCEAIPALRSVPRQTVWSALKSVRLALWDEDRGRLIGFSERRTEALAAE